MYVLLQALFLEYAKRNLRSVRDGTESSHSCTGEGFSWSRFPVAAAAVAHSKRSCSTRPSVVRRLWHGSSPKKDDNSKTPDTVGGNFEVAARSIEHINGSDQESVHGTAEDTVKLSAGFQISEQEWQSLQRAGETQDSESEPQKELNSVKEGKSINVETSSEPTVKPKAVHSDHNVKNQPHAESSSSRRSWSSTAGVLSTKYTAGKVPRSPLPVQSDDATSVTSQFGYVEDYFRLMAHIFNCIFR
jgi:plasmid maintenance system antidote protein VapI